MADFLADAARALSAGDWGSARMAYERVLEREPGHAEALYRLGCLLRDQGNLDAAAPLFRRAAAAAPERADVHADLGLLAWRVGDDAEASAHLTRGLAGYPDNLRLAGYLASALGGGEDVLARTLAQRPAWGAAELCAVGRELLVEPATYRAWFGAIATHLGDHPAFRHRAEAGGPGDPTGVPEPWGTVLALPEPRRVSACMIVRDEAHHLRRLLDSLQGAYDELVVLDTGSTDETVAIAQAYGARVGHFTWAQDFAAARNACLELATGDWIFMVDGDHELDRRSRRGLKRFLQRPPIEDGAVRVFQARIAEHFSTDRNREDSSYPHLAVYPNDPGLRYEGALHEQLRDRQVPPRPFHIAPIPDLVLHHDGYTPEALARHNKHARNMAILHSELAKRPHDPFVHYNLGLQLRAESRFDEAIQHLRRAVGLAAGARSALPPYVREALILVADAELRLKRYAALAATCRVGLATVGDDGDLLALAGLAALAQGDPAAAIPYLERALAQAGRMATTVSNAELTGWVAQGALAIAHHLTHQPDASQRHMAACWRDAPTQSDAVQRLLSLSQLATGGPGAAAPVLARIGVTIQVSKTPP